MNIQMMPGAVGTCVNPITVNGRNYSAAAGSALSVPDFDANVLEANGWMRSAGQGTGTTAQRPTTGLFKGFEYFDSSLGVNIKWDGKTWRNHATGAAA